VNRAHQDDARFTLEGPRRSHQHDFPYCRDDIVDDEFGRFESRRRVAIEGRAEEMPTLRFIVKAVPRPVGLQRQHRQAVHRDYFIEIASFPCRAIRLHELLNTVRHGGHFGC
jgi:hypothetical protein